MADLGGVTLQGKKGLSRFVSVNAVPAPAPVVPPRPQGDLTWATIEEIAQAVRTTWPTKSADNRWRRSRGARDLLQHLSEFPGQTWQERWQASGFNEPGRPVSVLRSAPRDRSQIGTGAACLFCLRVIQPSLSSCPPWLTAQLLAPCLKTGPLADMLEGNEPRELIREYYRLRRRARDLTASAHAAPGSSPFDDGHAPEAFLNWYTTRHDEVTGAAPEAAAIIGEEWGPHEYLDERSFYACSPHRIEMAAHLIRESYVADYANPALRLLPEWTQWCIERTGLDGDAASQSREAARLAASALVHNEDGEPTAEDSKAPFRREE